MKLIVDENISFAKEAFSSFGDVELIHGRKITRESLYNVEILIVRSITGVNKQLLEGTPVKFVGTATIGTDHVDKEYLKSKNIRFTDAKGCNADAVAEYVFTAVTNIASAANIPLQEKTIGIAGVGNIGSRIVKHAHALGLKTILNDPPLERKTGSKEFRPLSEVLKADIITIHVPLNNGGPDNTVHLFNSNTLESINENAILINASRGQVIDNTALLSLKQRNNLPVVLDVWENEPDINVSLLEKVNLGTPHIAGYSLEGKVNGTKMIYDALSEFCGTKPSWQPVLAEPKDSIIEINGTGNLVKDISELFNTIYNISRDSKELKKMLWMDEKERGSYFDLLRKNYPLRREFINYRIRIKNDDETLRQVLKSFRFQVIE